MSPTFHKVFNRTGATYGKCIDLVKAKTQRITHTPGTSLKAPSQRHRAFALSQMLGDLTSTARTSRLPTSPHGQERLVQYLRRGAGTLRRLPRLLLNVEMHLVSRQPTSQPAHASRPVRPLLGVLCRGAKTETSRPFRAGSEAWEEIRSPAIYSTVLMPR